MRGRSRSNPWKHTLDFPYKIGRRRARRPVVEDPVLLKALHRLEGHASRIRDLEARKIGQDAVEHLGIDEDKPL